MTGNGLNTTFRTFTRSMESAICTPAALTLTLAGEPSSYTFQVTPRELQRSGTKIDCPAFSVTGQIVHDRPCPSAAFRFFSPYGSPGKFLGEKGRLLFHMGVNMQPGLGNAGQAQAPEEWELTALRLMANGSRMEMLHAMAERPMSGQELAQKLNLNSGSVFRDLNSLYNARLLLMESTGGRNCYRTNLPVVRNMMERMLNYLQNQG